MDISQLGGHLEAHLSWHRRMSCLKRHAAARAGRAAPPLTCSHKNSSQTELSYGSGNVHTIKLPGWKDKAQVSSSDPAGLGCCALVLPLGDGHTFPSGLMRIIKNLLWSFSGVLLYLTAGALFVSLQQFHRPWQCQWQCPAVELMKSPHSAL